MNVGCPTQGTYDLTFQTSWNTYVTLSGVKAQVPSTPAAAAASAWHCSKLDPGSQLRPRKTPQAQFITTRGKFDLQLNQHHKGNLWQRQNKVSRECPADKAIQFLRSYDLPFSLLCTCCNKWGRESSRQPHQGVHPGPKWSRLLWKE